MEMKQHLPPISSLVIEACDRSPSRTARRRPAVVALVQAVVECHHLLKLHATNRDITIHDLFEPGMPRLWADERAMRQIRLNLLSNAIKFTPQGGAIWHNVGWTAAGGQYLSVKDTGPAFRNTRFRSCSMRSARARMRSNPPNKGAGLGLPIVKSLIELHGGTFSRKSKLRESTEVVVTFPPERAMVALEPMAETRMPSIFDPPPIVPDAPNPDGHSAIGGFLASINFGPALRGRSKAASHVVAPVAILLASQLPRLPGVSVDRADMLAANYANNWYHALVESRHDAPCAVDPRPERRNGCRFALRT
jgi:hypothetical protein